jgi:hypothetical protein
LAVLLADMHVSGKIRWDAYEQATHVSDLFNIYGKSYVPVVNDPSRESDAFWAIKNATDYLKALPASDIQDLKAGNPPKIIMIRNLQRAIEDVATLAGVKL